MSKSISSRPTPWQQIVLLCGKCSRKLDGGFGPGGKESLRKAVRSELNERGYGRQVRIIETRCMGLCPKKAVTAVNASRPDAVLAIPAGTPAEQVVDHLVGQRHVADPLIDARDLHADREIPMPANR